MAFKTANNKPSMTADGIPYIWTSTGGDVVTTATALSMYYDSTYTTTYMGYGLSVGSGLIAFNASENNGIQGGKIWVSSMNKLSVPSFYINCPITQSNDNFGTSIAINSGRIITGQPGYAGPSYSYSFQGRAYMWDQSGNLVATIENPLATTYCYFGACVAAGNGIFVVSAAPQPGLARNVGQVYIYNKTGVLQKTITDPGNAIANCFGSSVAVSCGRLVILSPGNYRLYVYDLAGNLINTITAPSGAVYFGQRNSYSNPLSVGSGRIVVGDYGYNNRSGRYHIYDLNCNLIRTIAPSVPNGLSFGSSTAIGSGRIVIGAPGNNSIAGVVYVFDLDGNLITSISDTQAQQAGSPYNYWGTNVAVQLGVIVISSPNYGYDLSGFNGHGKVVTYKTGYNFTPYDAIDLTYG